MQQNSQDSLAARHPYFSFLNHGRAITNALMVRLMLVTMVVIARRLRIVVQWAALVVR